MKWSLKFAIYDLNKEYNEWWKHVLDEYGSQHGIKIEMNYYHDAFDFLYSVYKYSYDCVVIDNDNCQLSGVKLGQIIKTIHKKTKVIFTGRHYHMMKDFYRIHAFQYYLKPLNIPDVIIDLNRFINEYQEENQYQFIRTRDGYARLSIQDVLYIEKVKDVYEIHTQNDILYVSSHCFMPMKEDLALFGIYALSQCISVNFHHIVALRKYEVRLSNDVSLCIPKRRYFKMKKQLQTFFNE